VLLGHNWLRVTSIQQRYQCRQEYFRMYICIYMCVTATKEMYLAFQFTEGNIGNLERWRQINLVSDFWSVGPLHRSLKSANKFLG